MTTMEPQITFHGLQPSAPLEREVRKHISWLEQFYPGLIGCRVRLEVPHRHHSHGRHMHVHIELSVPGGPPILIAHEPSLQPALDDATLAIREAFAAARRRLQDFAREQRGDVKTHVSP